MDVGKHNILGIGVHTIIGIGVHFIMGICCVQIKIELGLLIKIGIVVQI